MLGEEVKFWCTEQARQNRGDVWGRIEEELDSFEQVFLEQGKITVKETIQPFSLRKNRSTALKTVKNTFQAETGVTLSTTDQSEVHSQNETGHEKQEHSTSATQDHPKEEVKTGKNDHGKNLPDYTFTQAVKAYVSERHRARVGRLLLKEGVDSSQHERAINYFREKVNWRVQLKDLYHILNGGAGGEEEQMFTRSFQRFYQWYLRRIYPLHLLKKNFKKTTSERKQDYLQGKNKLIYLPSLTDKALHKINAASKASVSL